MSLTSLQNAWERLERNLLSPQDEVLIVTEANCIPSVASKTVIIGRGRSAVAVYRVLVDETTHLRTDVRAIIGNWSVQVLAGRPTG